MKKKIVMMLAMMLLLLAAGCDSQQADMEPAEEMRLVQVPGLYGGEQPGSEDAGNIELDNAWYYNDTDYFLCGFSNTDDNVQSLVYRMAAGADPELLLVWPEEDFHSYGDVLNNYYLPDGQKLVLYNERQHKFLIYDNAAEQAEEVTIPASAGLTPDDQAFWLGGGQYLFCRFKQDPQNLQRMERLVSLYDEKTGAEEQLFSMACAWCYFVPPTEEQPDRYLLTSSYGDLYELILPEEGEKQVKQHSCSEEWPTSEPFLYYGNIRPVQNAGGDYAVWEVWSENGKHYQVVDLAGGVLGECSADDKNNGELLAAYGDKIYFSKNFIGTQDACLVEAYNYIENSREVIFGTSASGFAEDYPEIWDFENGIISPDGRRLMMFAEDYVLSLPLVESENEAGND